MATRTHAQTKLSFSRRGSERPAETLQYRRDSESTIGARHHPLQQPKTTQPICHRFSAQGCYVRCSRWPEIAFQFGGDVSKAPRCWSILRAGRKQRWLAKYCGQPASTRTWRHICCDEGKSTSTGWRPRRSSDAGSASAKRRPITTGSHNSRGAQRSQHGRIGHGIRCIHGRGCAKAKVRLGPV